MHERPTHTRVRLPRLLNHEWVQTPTVGRHETEPGKMASIAASLITGAVTSLDLQTPARSVFSRMSSSSRVYESPQSFKIHFPAVLQPRWVAGNVKFLHNPAPFGSPRPWIKDHRGEVEGEEWPVEWYQVLIRPEWLYGWGDLFNITSNTKACRYMVLH